jgi:hypothetical protein
LSLNLTSNNCQKFVCAISRSGAAHRDGLVNGEDVPAPDLARGCCDAGRKWAGTIDRNVINPQPSATTVRELMPVEVTNIERAHHEFLRV